MDTNLSVLHIILLLPIFAQSQEFGSPTRNGSTMRSCSFIVKSCKTQCALAPQRFVRWTVDGRNGAVHCQLLDGNSTNMHSPDSKGNDLLSTTFEVPCCLTLSTSSGCPRVQCPEVPRNFTSIIRNCSKCPKNCSTKPCPNVTEKPDPKVLCTNSGNKNQEPNCLSDERLHTLLILGVTTLTSILLMCLFILLGLIFYRKKNRTYRMDSSSEENHSFSKEKKTPSTTLTISDCSQENNTPSTSSQNLPPHYVKSTNTKLNNQSEYENTGHTGCSASDIKRLSMQEYVNQEDLKTLMPNSNFPRSIRVKKENVEMGEMESATSNNQTTAVGEFEIRGGFIQPKRTSTKSENQSSKITDSEGRAGDLSLSDDIALHFESTQQMSPFPDLTDIDENPYVEAPAMKSPRCHTNFESPDAYQTLMTSNSNHTTDPNEYNMLLHNTTVANADSKALLFMNNNSHQQLSCKSNHKSEVTLKPPPNLTMASEA